MGTKLLVRKFYLRQKMGVMETRTLRVYEPQINIIKFRDGWAVLKRGNQRATRWFRDKQEAVTSALPMLEKGFHVIVHREDGSVERWLEAIH